jgi:hypothetical protein
VSHVAAAAPARTSPDLDSIARSYVRLALALGVHDKEYVDSYYGPPTWRTEAESLRVPLAKIRQQATGLVRTLETHPSVSRDSIVRLRHGYLLTQLRSLAWCARIRSGERLTFDEESRALYDAVAPRHPDSYFAAALAILDSVLPGDGALVERYDAFQKRYVVPEARLDTVIRAALAECRARTLRHIALPEGERFTVELVKGKSWGAYNWYQGGYRSLIQINVGLPVYVDGVVGYAGHEGYPGHHVNQVLYEHDLLKKRGWIEFSILPLFSPQGMIAEGSATFGVDVLFTPAERLEFEQRVLYPLAGLDPATATKYAEVRAVSHRLAYASNEAGRRYLDGEADSAATVAWLARYALRTPERAARQIQFFNQYRSYIINYNLGEDVVKAYVESRGGTPGHPDLRWKLLREVIATPRTPSSLGSRSAGQARKATSLQ